MSNPPDRPHDPRLHVRFRPRRWGCDVPPPRGIARGHVPGPGCTTPPTRNVGGLSPKTEPCEPISRRWAGPQRVTSQPYGDVSRSRSVSLYMYWSCGPVVLSPVPRARAVEFWLVVCRVCVWLQRGGALRVTVCCARATQTASSPDLMQVGLRARRSPTATC